MKRAALAATAAALVACGGLLPPPPTVSSLVVTPDRCGGWTATIDATGSNDSLILDQDGQIVHSFAVTGTQTVTATGTAAPTRTSVFTATIAESSVATTVMMPPMDATLQLAPQDGVFADGTAATIDATLSTPCRFAGATMRATLVDPTDPNRATVWRGDPIAITAASPARIAIPPQRRGLYALVVELEAGDVPIATNEAGVYWGDPGDDLDRDGVPGGIDGEDCDDRDKTVHPGQEEQPVANGKDDDCDGTVDEGTSAYDDDGDGLSEDAGDCDDMDPGRHPGAAERADCRDQDCDGTADEGVTLVAQDDPYEPNDTADRPYDLRTSRDKSFNRELEVVTRELGDDEWFEFFSQDGDWDAWGIDVFAAGVPDGATYDLEIWDDGGSPRQVVRVRGGSHDTLSVRGAMFRDDSGDYRLRIHPVEIAKPWCPITVRLHSY